jgi:hypothetical protein
MFILGKRIGQLFVTFGVWLSCILFALQPLPCVWKHKGAWCLIPAICAFLLIIGVWMGTKSGYLASRWIWRLVAFMFFFGGLLNPIAWLDALSVGFELIWYTLLFLPIALFLSYCLSKHAKSRQIAGTHKWRDFP